MHTSRFSSLPRSFKHGLFLALLGLLLLSGMLGTTAILLKPPKAHAQGGIVPTWCQNWDSNPANTSDKVPISNQYTLSDGSVVEIDEGYWPQTKAEYVWANMPYGISGDLVALEWTWLNGSTYQCGDSHGGPWATVWSAGGATWTAGVPFRQLANNGPFCILYELTNHDFGNTCY